MTEIQNILIVDDEKSNIDILLELFNALPQPKTYNIIVSLNGKKALEILQQREIDLVLLDIVMPDMDGYEVCRRIKNDPKTQDIPVLFITANTDDLSIAKAYDIGASDYVTKPFRSVELIARVLVNLKLQKTIKQLEHLAYYDTLSGLYNRRKFFELATEAFETSKETLFVAMIDIDHFKNINDTYGHAIGDKAIKALADVFKASLGPSQIVGRIGGEEFAILCNTSDEQKVQETIQKIQQSASNLSITNQDGTQKIALTISSGIAKFDPSIPTIDHLLQKADNALYEAKQSGRNRYIFRV